MKHPPGRLGGCFCMGRTNAFDPMNQIDYIWFYVIAPASHPRARFPGTLDTPIENLEANLMPRDVMLPLCNMGGLR